MLKLPTLLTALSLAFLPALPATAQLGLSGAFTASRLSHPVGAVGSPTTLYGETVSAYYQRRLLRLRRRRPRQLPRRQRHQPQLRRHRTPHRLQAPRPSATDLRRGPRRLQQLHRRPLRRQHHPGRVPAHRRRRLHHLSPHRLARRRIHLHQRLQQPQLALAQHRSRRASALKTSRASLQKVPPAPFVRHSASSVAVSLVVSTEVEGSPSQTNAFPIAAVHPRSPSHPAEASRCAHELTRMAPYTF